MFHPCGTRGTSQQQTPGVDLAPDLPAGVIEEDSAEAEGKL